LLRFAIWYQIFGKMRLKTVPNPKIPPNCYAFNNFFWILNYIFHCPGCCHNSARSVWKRNTIEGFYDRKVDEDGNIYYVRESITRGIPNNHWYPPTEEPVVVEPVAVKARVENV